MIFQNAVWGAQWRHCVAWKEDQIKYSHFRLHALLRSRTAVPNRIAVSLHRKLQAKTVAVVFSAMKSSRPLPWPWGGSRTLYKVLGLGRQVLGLGLGHQVLGFGLGLGSQVLDNWLPHNNFTFCNYSMKQNKLENLNKKRLHLHCYLLGSSSSFIIIL